MFAIERLTFSSLIMSSLALSHLYTPPCPSHVLFMGSNNWTGSFAAVIKKSVEFERHKRIDVERVFEKSHLDRAPCAQFVIHWNCICEDSNEIRNERNLFEIHWIKKFTGYYCSAEMSKALPIQTHKHTHTSTQAGEIRLKCTRKYCSFVCFNLSVISVHKHIQSCHSKSECFVIIRSIVQISLRALARLNRFRFGVLNSK